MQLNSLQNISYVSLLDGYSFLPDVPSSVAWKELKLDAVGMSVLMHEFCHQHALFGPFGMVCAIQHAARRSIGVLTRQAASAEMRGVPDIVFRGPLTDAATLLANSQDLVGLYKYFLEGMAMYCQVDLKVSRTSKSMAALFEFFAVARATLSADRKAAVESAAIAFDQIQQQYSEDGRLRFFLFNPVRANSHYFLGYLMVRGCHQRLMKTVPELADPEIFFILLQSYLFFDLDLLWLASPGETPEYRARLTKHLSTRIQALLSAAPKELARIVNGIEDFENSPVNYAHMDVARSLQHSKFVGWIGSEFESRRDGAIESVVSFLFRTFPLEPQDQYQLAPIRESHQLLAHTLLILMKYFKLFHDQAYLLRHTPDPETPTIAYVTRGGLWGFNQPITPAESIAVAGRAAREGVTLPTDNDRVRALFNEYMTGSKAKAQADLATWLKQREVLLMESYDLYSLLSRKRIRVLFKAELHVITSYTLEASGKLDIPKIDQQALEFLRGALSPSYIADIADDQIISLLPEIDPAFEIEQIHALWRIIFPETSCTAAQLAQFGSEKANMLAFNETQRRLLLANWTSPPTSEVRQRIEYQHINRRWRWLTGSDFA